MNSVACHICGFDDVVCIPEYESLHRVTSDCKPWPQGGRLVVCRRCGCAQAVTDSIWTAEADRIYQNYTIYHQAQGAEQSVFDQASGIAAARSDRLLDRLQQEIRLPTAGRLLDIGCGNGALLRAFNHRWPEWRLAGVEVTDQNRKIVEQIPGVEQLFIGAPETVPGTFDCISLVHVLEHIARPTDFLHRIADKINDSGHLLVEVPDCEQNPFMFVVADHATHFFQETLRAAVASAGYEITAVAGNWIAKEITVVGTKRTHSPGTWNWPSISDAATPVRQKIEWLNRMVAQCRTLRSRNALGIFGTSIAATWLFSELNGNVDFFVDEDPNRIGQKHLDRPILAPNAAPPESRLFVALPPFLARNVAARIQMQMKAECVLPPELNQA